MKRILIYRDLLLFFGKKKKYHLVFLIIVFWLVASPVLAVNSNSVELNGSNQIIKANDNAGLEIANTMTFELWLNPQTLPTGGGRIYIANRDPDDNANRVWALSLIEISGRYRMQIYNSSDGTNTNTSNQNVSSLIDLETGEWYHLAWVVNSATVNFYLNGEGVGSASSLNSSMYTGGTSQLTVGSYDTGQSNFVDGYIDDIRLWNDVRTAQEIADNFEKELSGTESNLVGYWKLNNNYDDSTATNNDMSGVNTPTFSTEVPFADDVVEEETLVAPTTMHEWNGVQLQSIEPFTFLVIFTIVSAFWFFVIKFFIWFFRVLTGF